jgi:CSLREA domain-containing protein
MSERSFRRDRRRRAESARRRERRRRTGLTATIAMGAFALSAPAAQAANFEVNSTADAAADACELTVGGCTLRDAVTAAGANMEADEITFHSSVTGTIRLTEGQLINPGTAYEVSIVGPGRDVLTVSGDADNSGTPNAGDSRIFIQSAGAARATISGLTLADGFESSGGAVAGDGGALTITSSRITSSTATGLGGAINSTGVLEINDTIIDANEATAGDGGAVATNVGAVINDSQISGNTAGGNGGAIRTSGKYAPLTLTDSTVTGNEAAQGGGIYTDSFQSNPDPGKYLGGDADVTIARSTISENTATGVGGGISFGDTFVNTGIGPFPVPSVANISIAQSTFSGNEAGAASNGGAIAFTSTLRDTPVRLTSSTISGNEAGAGAGISFAGPPGAPLAAGTSSFELGNSTIARNDAALRGGGLYLGAYDTGGGPTSATVSLTGTIVGDNTATGVPQDLDRADGSGAGGFPLAFSLVEAPGDAPVTQDPGGSAITGQDPQLGALAANGGPTQTQLPALTSPAIDKGLAAGLTTDQRGAARIVDIPSVANAPGGDASDIGSVEQPVPAVTPPAKAKKKCKKKKKKGKKNAAPAKKKKKKCKKKKRKKKK